LRQRAAAGLALAVGGLAQAFAQVGIYTCVDAKGRRITSDRPIVECLDREQKELTPTGGVKRIIKPAQTAEEIALEEEKARKAAEERARIAEEKKRERVLLARYPDRATHDRERAQALVAVDSVITAAKMRITELEYLGRRIGQEAEFYRNDPSKIPPKIKRQIDQNEQEIAAQKRFVANQTQEKERVNARFNDELAKLRQLWAAQKPAAAAATAPSSAAKH